MPFKDRAAVDHVTVLDAMFLFLNRIPLLACFFRFPEPEAFSTVAALFPASSCEALPLFSYPLRFHLLFI